MSSNITFSGLATGIDSASIIDKLVAAEKTPANLINTRLNAANKRISVLSDLSTRLKALGNAAKALDSSSEVRQLKSTSSVDSLVKVTGTSAASPGSWAVRVDQLARAETSRSTTFATDAAGVAGTGSVSIAVGSAAAVQVDFTASDSLSDVAARINQNVAGVNASVLHDGSQYRLIVTSAETGTSKGLTFTETGSPLGMTEAVGARDAIFDIAGTTVTRASNTVSDVIPGVTLDLVGVSQNGATTTVQVSRDPAAQSDAVKKVVDAYNDVAKVLNAQLSYGGVKKGEDTLFGDPGIQALQRNLSRTVVTTYAGNGTVGNGTSARDLGITLNADGTLALDATKLTAAVAKDPSALEKLLVGTSSNGLSAALQSLSTDYTGSAGTIATKQSGLRSMVSRYQDQIDRIDSSAEAMEERLRLQYSRLEQSVSSMQSQLSYLSSLSG
jgi:flagellar hook-associated protein 2